MKKDVEDLINKCKNTNDGTIFLSLKPRIDDLNTTVAHLYSAGGRMCYFNMPDGNGFHIWDKEYEKYAYGKFEFNRGKGFRYLFSNWDNMKKTCYNRAHDKDNRKIEKISGKKPKNHYERMRENMIAAYNTDLTEDMMAVIDIEYFVDKSKIDNEIMKNPKADLVCATVKKDRLFFYITEYKSTEDGFGVSLQDHYNDMSMFFNDIRIKKHLIKTLQERLKYDLITCKDEVADKINNLSVNNIDDIDVNLLFLFSNAPDYEKARANVLNRGYEYISEQSKTYGVSTKYAYIKKIEAGCLKNTILRDFEMGGKFELD